jgi:hypothetical protein
VLDADLAGLLEEAEQRCMAGEHPEFTLGGAGHHHVGGAGPDFFLDGHQLDL